MITMFKPVSSKVSFPQIEERILRLWRERGIFEKSLQWHRDAPQFTLYDGPPTANGSPGIHHILSRVFKDVIPRYKTMRGYFAPRKAGWDTHGLPVELEVERGLGFTSKAQIEQFGVAQFNARCRESVRHYLKEWEELTQRIGFWIDLEHPYITFENSYIESCWWIVKQLWDKGLIYQGYRVTPHCPRCGTSLSSHEVALGYRDDTEDPSIYIRFRLSSSVQPENARSVLEKLGWDFQKNRWERERPSLLAWTTTPWTLTGNVSLAVAPDEDYVLVQSRTKQGVSERLILAKALLAQALGIGNWQILEEFPGRDLAGVLYERLYEPKAEFVVVGGGELRKYNHIVWANFVSVTDGTGIVHIAPAFGEEDYELGKSEGLPMVQTVDLEGKLIPNNRPWDGKFVKEADPMILDDLEQRNLLHHRDTIRHTYPFCWRCETPLLYYAKPSWYIKTTALKDELISGNAQIIWYPEHIKHGRFGDWLENNVDWAFSRERYWGTPLPIWRCEGCSQVECVGSIEELKDKPSLKGLEEPLDLHRPFVDQVTYLCPKCSGEMRRVPEVLDCWFDS
ncbi:MAG TPA: class I tRNA ligase family protein [Dehalococcoidia bacterium]|nr:class I tRNA ligase family protein [Dehalococcoidia bacterium]